MKPNIKQYEDAIQKLAQFDAENESILSKRAKLEEKVLEQETALKEVAINNGESIDIPSLSKRFVYSQAYKKSVNIEELVQLLHKTLEGEELVNALAKIQDISFITVKVDDFIEAIRDGALPNEVRSALVEVPNKPSVSIRDIK